MKYLLSALVLLCLSCREVVKPKESRIVIRQLPDSTIALKADTVPKAPGRYFLISYITRERDWSDHGIEGQRWFETNLFPSHLELDSIIYSGLPKSKKCYQNIIFTNIYEFKTAQDYWRFRSDYWPPYKLPKCKSKDCCRIPPITFRLGDAKIPTEFHYESQDSISKQPIK